MDWRPTLLGTTVRLRPMVEEDFEALFLAASDPGIWEQHPDKTRHTREGFSRFFRSGMESGGALVALDKATGAIIGASRFTDHRTDSSSVEIGYTFLARAQWGTGTNAEMKRLMLEYAFRSVKKVYFVIGPENFRSRKAVEKLGATLAGEEGRRHVKDPRCSVVYVLAKPD